MEHGTDTLRLLGAQSAQVSGKEVWACTAWPVFAFGAFTAWPFALWKWVNVATTSETVHVAYSGVSAGVAVGYFLHTLGVGPGRPRSGREAEKAR